MLPGPVLGCSGVLPLVTAVNAALSKVASVESYLVRIPSISTSSILVPAHRIQVPKLRH